MNIDIFKTPDPSGKLSRESYLIKNHIEEYDFIVKYCIDNNLLDIPFKEKVYLTINEMKKIPICKNSNCGKRVNFKNSSLGYYDYCSNRCMSSDPEINHKKERTSLSKYGVTKPQKLDSIKEKIIKTNQEKYGSNSPMCLLEIQEKSKKTLLKNWGVDNPNKSPEIINKRIESFKISDYKESYKKTSLERYGVEHPWMSDVIHQKSVASSADGKNKITFDKINVIFTKYPKHKLISIDYESENRICTAICPLSHEFKISRQNLYERKTNLSEICTICNPICRGISGQEVVLLNFIKEIYNGEIIENTRKVIPPYEIDIFLPDLKIGFEFNGLWWHSSLNKDKNYHFNKYKMCSDVGVSLITIWEDDWIYKNEICKSLISSKIGLLNKIYARNCTVSEISYKESKIFLDNNHLQGDCKSSVKIGLFFEDKLVSLMTFSKLRIFMNRQNKDRDTYELTRFCNKIDISVIGGASKLLSFFIKKYNPKEIETYSDNMISNGNLYRKLGFEFSHETNPGYYYLINKKKENRFSYRKDILVREGFDKNKSEEEIMMERGYHRIYNAGNKKWIYKK